MWILLLALAVLIVPIALPILLIRDDGSWCRGEHDWVDQEWFSSCSKCPAEYNHYDRPGGVG